MKKITFVNQYMLLFFLLLCTGLKAEQIIISLQALPKKAYPEQASKITPINPQALIGRLFLYGGNSIYSDVDGKVSLPKQHSDKKVEVVVCNNISFSRIKNTITKVQSASEVDSKASEAQEKTNDTIGSDGKLFIFEKIKDENDKTSIKISAKDLKPGSVISQDQLILYDDPKAFFVTEGSAFVADSGDYPVSMFVDTTIANSPKLLEDVSWLTFFTKLNQEVSVSGKVVRQISQLSGKRENQPTAPAGNGLQVTPESVAKK